METEGRNAFFFCVQIPQLNDRIFTLTRLTVDARFTTSQLHPAHLSPDPVNNSLSLTPPRVPSDSTPRNIPHKPQHKKPNLPTVTPAPPHSRQSSSLPRASLSVSSGPRASHRAAPLVPAPLSRWRHRAASSLSSASRRGRSCRCSAPT